MENPRQEDFEDAYYVRERYRPTCMRVEGAGMLEQEMREPEPQVEGQRPVLRRTEVQPRHRVEKPGTHAHVGIGRPLQFVVAVVAGVEDQPPLREHRDDGQQ